MTQPPTGLSAHVLDLRRVKRIGESELIALDNVTASFGQGQLTAVFGPSGAGKTTLCNVLAGLEPATAGKVSVAGQDLRALTEPRLTKLRRGTISLLPQEGDLVPTLSAGENLLLPMTLGGERPTKAWFDEVIAAAGIGEILKHAPSELSPGQQQLVAAARALLPRPAILLADEPTGRLTWSEGQRVLRLLTWARDEAGATIVLFTHDPAVAAHANRVLILSDGHITADLQDPGLVAMLTKLAELEAARTARTHG